MTPLRPPLLRPIVALVTSLMAFASSATAAPLHQTLSRAASRVTFGVDSQSEALKMNGSLKDFSGTILIDPTKINEAQMKLSAALSSATLPPDQIMQAILLQTFLARVENRRTTFESTSIEHVRGARYIVHGKYSTGDRTRPVALPIDISKVTRDSTEIRINAREPFDPKKAPAEIAALARGSQGTSGWAAAKLVFFAPKTAS
jgi:polyisoprenoid-binding protein YceI